MINKIEYALPYDEERDGLPSGRGNKALAVTGCWL